LPTPQVILPWQDRSPQLTLHAPLPQMMLLAQESLRPQSMVQSLPSEQSMTPLQLDVPQDTLQFQPLGHVQPLAHAS